jgi:hypothetical protein
MWAGPLRVLTFPLVVLSVIAATPAGSPVTIAAASGAVIDLADLFGNSGFEDDLEHLQWISTLKSANYVVSSTVVNPVIVPKNEVDALEAPDGDNFIGVVNPLDDNVNGRLVHEAVAGVFPGGTVFTITVLANRGRLADAPRAIFEAKPSPVSLQFFGFRSGAYPIVDPFTDNWSRTPAVKISRAFTDWGPNGEWASQTFTFTSAVELRYVSLSITVKNHKRASYAAFDVAR